MKRPQLLLWDLDGTLVDSIELIVRSYQHALSAVGIEVTREDILPAIGTSLPEDLERRAPGHGLSLLETYRAFNRDHHAAMVTLYPGVASALDAVAALGVAQGLVTSKSRAQAALAFEQFGLDRHMQVIVTHEDTVRHKPDPAPLLEAAARVGAAAGACWYVGDSTHDMLAAKRAGVWAVAAAWGCYPRSALELLADAIIATPEELVPLITGRE
jgi:pyrophosphatase PpaX